MLIAGGIGITPILSMAKTLSHVNLDFALHYFARSERHIAFSREVSRLGSDAELHVGLSAEQTQDQVSKILEKCEYIFGAPIAKKLAQLFFMIGYILGFNQIYKVPFSILV